MSSVLEQLRPHIIKWRKDLNAYGEKCVTIVDTDTIEKPFKLNRAQQFMEERVEDQKKRKGYVRAIFLKGRQQGASKYNCLRQLRNTTLFNNVSAFVMAHDSKTTASLFSDYKYLYDSLPNVMGLKHTLKKSNANDLVFECNNSSVTIGTAGNSEIGRGMTINRFHGSEVAFWPNGEKILSGVLQAVPLSKDTEIILESTANGVGNKFYKMCMQAMKGEGEFELVFIPWWWTDRYELTPDSDYTPSDDDWEYFDTYMAEDCDDEEHGRRKLCWRQAKLFELGEKKFKQEYPANPTEAFQMSGNSLFRPEWIKCARDTKIKPNPMKPLVIGVDAAEAGGDRTSICFRRGEVITHFQVYDTMDEMQLAGICAKIIETHKPKKIFFDKAYANGCVGRLKELGYGKIVQAIAFAQSPIEKDRFLNKRAEMHMMLREWIEQGYLDYDPDTGMGGVDIPDDDAFNADLACIPEPPPTSNGKIKMVEKAKIKAEFGMSPDLLDSAILTFAEPIAEFASNGTIKVKANSATKRIYGK